MRLFLRFAVYTFFNFDFFLGLRRDLFLYFILVSLRHSSIIDDGVSVTSVITQLLRLHQISCGFTRTDTKQDVELKSARLEELMNILEETEGKVIIWANYRYDIQRILRAIQDQYGKASVGAYYGDTTDDERRNTVQLFQDKSSELKYIVGNTQTGGIAS